MVDVLVLLWSALTSLFRSRGRLEAEILVLRQQINVLRRTSRKRFVFGTFDRLVFVGLYRLVPGIVDALSIVRPETVVRWHRAGFRLFWRWQSRRRGGRPRIPPEIRKLIRDMSLANPLWGAPRIHGELLKLGIDVGQTSVATYMAQRTGGPSPGWRCSYRKLYPEWLAAADRVICCGMIDGLKLLACIVVSLFRSKGRLEAEIVILRHQLNILRRRKPSRARLTLVDRLIFVWLYRLRSSVLSAVVIVQPETVVRWHREGFRLYWRWKSRARGGRPRIPRDLRDLIREMSRANPLWGAPRIHGELLKLGIEVAPSTVAKYMARCRRPPKQSWKTFLHNHAAGIAAMDLSWCRRSTSASSIFWSSSAIIGDGSYRSVSPLIRRRSGSLDRSTRHFRGPKLRAT